MLPAQQFILFCLVGVLTTALDFVVFNLLTRPRVGWSRIAANLVSVAAAMAWSFFANWFIVFHPDTGDWLVRAGRFLVTTAFSAFVLQNAVLYVTTYVWKVPVNAVLFVVRRSRVARRFSEDVWARNTCKTLAVCAGLVWNFCWYKLFVYAE